MPTFGRDTIRRFSTNSSEMKKMAAHNFEDLLQVCCTFQPYTPSDPPLQQCAIPAFENLLAEPHNRIVLDLLFIMAQWHGLAKLRMHTDETLNHLDKLTTSLGDQLRKFKTRTCSAFKTKALPREVRAQDARNASREKQSTRKKQPVANSKKTKNPKRKRKRGKNKLKEFELNTYKNHALGHYVEVIRRYGTADLLSTESVSTLNLLFWVNTSFNWGHVKLLG